MVNILADLTCHQTVKIGDDMQYSCKSGREKIFGVFFFPCCKIVKKPNGEKIPSTKKGCLLTIFHQTSLYEGADFSFTQNIYTE